MSMEMDHSFTVPVAPERAWDVLLDVERIAPCMPGATVDEFDGEVVTGRIKVKVGPVSLTYRGTAKFIERDPDAHVVVIEASGKETRGAGTASATVRASLEPESSGQATKVTMHTTMNVTGRPAQFGRGVMVEVGGKLVEKFAENLAQQISGNGAAAPTGTAPRRRRGGRRRGGRRRGGRRERRPGHRHDDGERVRQCRADGHRSRRKHRFGPARPAGRRLPQPGQAGRPGDPQAGRPGRPRRDRAGPARPPLPSPVAPRQGLTTIAIAAALAASGWPDGGGRPDGHRRRSVVPAPGHRGALTRLEPRELAVAVAGPRHRAHIRQQHRAAPAGPRRPAACHESCSTASGRRRR